MQNGDGEKEYKLVNSILQDDKSKRNNRYRFWMFDCKIKVNSLFYKG